MSGVVGCDFENNGVIECGSLGGRVLGTGTGVMRWNLSVFFFLSDLVGVLVLLAEIPFRVLVAGIGASAGVYIG